MQLAQNLIDTSGAVIFNEQDMHSANHHLVTQSYTSIYMNLVTMEMERSMELEKVLARMNLGGDSTSIP